MTDAGKASPGLLFFLLTGLSLSVGWGIRGNFGHEYGAMIAGALAGLAVVALSGREDWASRSAYFGMFGALGWSFGGSISYMQVIAYTHSGHSPSVLYGFAALFVIGFLWAAPGGAGTSFVAYADRQRLTDLFAPMTAVFAAWWLQGVLVTPAIARVFGPKSLNWYDTDWLAAGLAIVAVMLLAGVRRRIDSGTTLILHMAVGWWAGFLILVVGLGLRMTPPRGDNWSGCLGMTIGLVAYFARNGLEPVARVTILTGLLGGTGFAAASMLKLVEVTSGLSTNWHSILEQTTGLFNGLALAAAMRVPARTAPRIDDDPPPRWTEVYAVGFVLIVITYLNLNKNVAEWVRMKAMPPVMLGLPASVWFALAYVVLAAALLVPLSIRRRRPLALLPADPFGRCQLLFLVFIWWMVVGNFERALVSFTAQRLVTEWVVLLNAGICTLLILLGPGDSRPGPVLDSGQRLSISNRAIVLGSLTALLMVFVDWGVVRSIYGDTFAGHANKHIRFGPDATVARPDSPR